MAHNCGKQLTQCLVFSLWSFPGKPSASAHQGTLQSCGETCTHSKPKLGSPSPHAFTPLYPLNTDVTDVIHKHLCHWNIISWCSNDVMLFLGGIPAYMCTIVWALLPQSEHVYAQLTSMESEMAAQSTCCDTLSQVHSHVPTSSLPG